MIDLVAKRDDMDTRNGKGETFWIPPSPEISQYRLALEYLSGLSQNCDNLEQIMTVVDLFVPLSLNGLVEAAERGMIVLEFCVKLASQTGESMQVGFVSWVQEKFDIFSMTIDESDGHLHHDPLVINAVDQSESYILEFLQP